MRTLRVELAVVLHAIHLHDDHGHGWRRIAANLGTSERLLKESVDHFHAEAAWRNKVNEQGRRRASR